MRKKNKSKSYPIKQKWQTETYFILFYVQQIGNKLFFIYFCFVLLVDMYFCTIFESRLKSHLFQAQTIVFFGKQKKKLNKKSKRQRLRKVWIVNAISSFFRFTILTYWNWAHFDQFELRKHIHNNKLYMCIIYIIYGSFNCFQRKVIN